MSAGKSVCLGAEHLFDFTSHTEQLLIDNIGCEPAFMCFNLCVCYPYLCQSEFLLSLTCGIHAQHCMALQADSILKGKLGLGAQTRSGHRTKLSETFARYLSFLHFFVFCLLSLLKAVVSHRLQFAANLLTS